MGIKKIFYFQRCKRHDILLKYLQFSFKTAWQVSNGITQPVHEITVEDVADLKTVSSQCIQILISPFLQNRKSISFKWQPEDVHLRDQSKLTSSATICLFTTWSSSSYPCFLFLKAVDRGKHQNHTLLSSEDCIHLVTVSGDSSLTHIQACKLVHHCSS